MAARNAGDARGPDAIVYELRRVCTSSTAQASSHRRLVKLEVSELHCV